MEIKLIDRLRSIEKFLGITFDPESKDPTNSHHKVQRDGRMDKIVKATDKPPAK